MSTKGGVQYSNIAEIKGPLVVVDGVENEQKGIDFLNNIHKTNDLWVQTSYNTYGGVHQMGGVPFRKNYAGKGGKYDKARDAFMPQKPFTSWILNEDSCRWEAPVAYPEDGKHYTWDEESQEWDFVS